MFPLFFAMLLLDSEFLYSLSCGDKIGTCCYLHEWDTEQGKCIPCNNGYYGENCDFKCLFPHYGHGCTSQCNCSANECDYVSGCKQLSTSTLTGTRKLMSLIINEKFYPKFLIHEMTLSLEKGIKDTKFIFCLVFLMLMLDLEFVYSSCEGGNGTCCYNFVWDTVQWKCLPCKRGYHGQNCTKKCSFPFYGNLCTLQCNCNVSDCDYVSGCKQSSTLKLTPTSTDNPSSKSTEVDNFVSAETRMNSACTHNYKSDYTSTKPFLVGIIVLASTAFIIILLTLYTYRLEMRQQ